MFNLREILAGFRHPSLRWHDDERVNSLLPLRLLHRFDDCHRLDRDAGDAHQEVDDLLFVVPEAVGVELGGNGRVLRLLLLVLVENPFEAGAVAEAVGPGGNGNAGERLAAVEDDAAIVLVRLQLRCGIGFRFGRVVACERPRLDGLIADVQHAISCLPQWAQAQKSGWNGMRGNSRFRLMA